MTANFNVFMPLTSAVGYAGKAFIPSMGETHRTKNDEETEMGGSQ